MKKNNIIQGHTIETKYLGPTDFRVTRVKVKSHLGSKTYNWAHNLTSEDNHLHAAEEFLKSLQADDDYLKNYSIQARASKCDDSGHIFIAAYKRLKEESTQ